MHLKYSVLCLCLVMCRVQAADASNQELKALQAQASSNSSSTSSGALECALVKTTSSNKVEYDKNALSALYYDYPGASSPVYYISDHHQVVAALRSQTRSGFPCGR